jgi:hypothetical protein
MLGFGATTWGVAGRIAALACAAGPSDRRREIAELAGWCHGDPFVLVAAIEAADNLGERGPPVPHRPRV